MPLQRFILLYTIVMNGEVFSNTLMGLTQVEVNRAITGWSGMLGDEDIIHIRVIAE